MLPTSGSTENQSPIQVSASVSFSFLERRSLRDSPDETVGCFVIALPAFNVQYIGNLESNMPRYKVGISGHSTLDMEESV